MGPDELGYTDPRFLTVQIDPPEITMQDIINRDDIAYRIPNAQTIWEGYNLSMDGIPATVSVQPDILGMVKGLSNREKRELLFILLEAFEESEPQIHIPQHVNRLKELLQSHKKTTS